MEKSVLKIYLTALGVLLALSGYPVFMGSRIVILQLRNGGIRQEDYARYVIPYTAICLAILIIVALYPIISRLRLFSTLAASVFGLGLFAGLELFMEGITINSPIAQSTVKWQLASCVGTAAAVKAFQKPYNDAYKIHYFLISMVIILIIIGIVYGYGNLSNRGDRSDIIPLRMQLIATALLLALCVFANFTGFFRNTASNLSPLSAFLTALFFVMLGVTSGIYAGSRLIKKGKTLSLFLPSIIAILICSIMYYGEFKLLDGNLYSFGKSFFFEGLPGLVVSPTDILIILGSGVITALLMYAARRKYF